MYLFKKIRVNYVNLYNIQYFHYWYVLLLPGILHNGFHLLICISCFVY